MAEAGEDYCARMHDHSLARWERTDAKHRCIGQHPQDFGGLDSAVSLLGGVLSSADHAITSEMAIEATDSSYGDYHQLGASPDAVHHAHNMQHTDVAMRAISEMLGFSHSMMNPQPQAAGASHAPASTAGR
ncbi:hypothetical protein KFE25_011603 [Diacronema lutheri]|mgnify:CR=1 FL=1|uniref:Uncharacterized protein n=2 Tax=Diacronema lutheri TaxID=2081491 RepID=A0A8J5X950_DIALT|nr:hypothetical protein KFE25_011603 [Diacronema lutheri]